MEEVRHEDDGVSLRLATVATPYAMDSVPRFEPIDGLLPGLDRSEDDVSGEKTRPPADETASHRSSVDRASDHVARPACRWSCCDRSDGSDAWLVAAMSLIISFVIATEFGSFGIYYIEYTKYFGVSKAAVGWIKGIQTISGGLFGLLGGTLVKVYGCRRMAFTGTLCAFVGMLTASLCQDIYMLYLTQGVLLGVGINMMHISTAVIVQMHFTRNPVLGTGVAFMGFGIGSLVSSIAISALIDACGLRSAVLLHSGVIAQALPASLLLRTPRAARGAAPAARSGREPPLTARLRAELRDYALLRRPKFCMFAGAGLLLHYTISTFVNHLPGRAVFCGTPRPKAAYLQLVVSVSSMVARLLSTLFANSGRVNKLAFYCAVVWLIALGPISYAFVRDFNQLVVPPAVYGLGMGSSTTVFLVVLVRLFGIDQLPKALSLYTIATSMGLSLGPPVSGLIFDSTQNYDVPFILAGCVCVCANVMLITVMLLHRHETMARQNANESCDQKL